MQIRGRNAYVSVWLRMQDNSMLLQVMGLACQNFWFCLALYHDFENSDN